MKNISTWLFNPFRYIAGRNALITGIVIIIAAAVIGSFSNSHFDGVLDFHTGADAPFVFFIIEGLVDWLVMGLLLIIAGFLISKTKFRVIDVIATQALARFPTLITALAALLPGYKIMVNKGNINSMFSWKDINSIVFLIVVFISLLMIIWMIMLMYRAFSVSCNVGGSKTVIFFIIVLITGEILSKVVLVSAIDSNYFLGKSEVIKYPKASLNAEQKPANELNAADNEPDESIFKNAKKSAMNWLKLIDNKMYNESWDEASKIFKKSITKEKWESALRSIKTPLGELVNRNIISKQHPDDKTIVFQFKTSYKNKNNTTETVTVMNENDGDWRISGYFIK